MYYFVCNTIFIIINLIIWLQIIKLTLYFLVWMV